MDIGLGAGFDIFMINHGSDTLTSFGTRRNSIINITNSYKVIFMGEFEMFPLKLWFRHPHFVRNSPKLNRKHHKFFKKYNGLRDLGVFLNFNGRVTARDV